MTISVGRIKTGLMQLKRMMGGSKPGLSVQTIQMAPHRTQYSNIPAAPQALYMNQATQSTSQSIAPPPSSLQSLASTIYNNQNSTENQVEQFMEQVSSDDSADGEQVSGQLGVIRDLQVYEDFIRSESEIFDEPEDPVGLRGLQGGIYRLERDSGAHVAGMLIRKLIDYWKKYYFIHDSPVTFTQFLLTISEPDLRMVWQTQDSHSTAEVIRRFKQGVRFLSDEKREKYRVTAKASGKLYWEKWGDSKPLDTVDQEFYKRKHQHLAFQTDQIAIWVLSKEDRLYTHAAKVHRFHHSSFLNGNAVKCAGDWEVKDGKLIWLSLASGHYKPTFENLFNAVNVLAKTHSIPATSYKVKVFRWGQGSQKTPELIPASQVLFDLKSIQDQFSPAP